MDIFYRISSVTTQFQLNWTSSLGDISCQVRDRIEKTSVRLSWNIKRSVEYLLKIFFFCHNFGVKWDLSDCNTDNSDYDTF